MNARQRLVRDGGFYARLRARVAEVNAQLLATQKDAHVFWTAVRRRYHDTSNGALTDEEWAAILADASRLPKRAINPETRELL